MKVVLIRDDFIEELSRVDNQVQKKNNRPHLIIETERNIFAIPLSTKNPMEKSKKKSRKFMRDYYYELAENSYIYFHKCILIHIESSVIGKDFLFSDEHKQAARKLKLNKENIEEKFRKYLQKHPVSWSINEEENKKVQNKIKKLDQNKSK